MQDVQYGIVGWRAKNTSIMHCTQRNTHTHTHTNTHTQTHTQKHKEMCKTPFSPKALWKSHQNFVFIISIVLAINESGLLIARDGDRRGGGEGQRRTMWFLGLLFLKLHSFPRLPGPTTVLYVLVHFGLLWSGAMLCLLIRFVTVRIELYSVSHSEDTS